jgi:hypothetical protein
VAAFALEPALVGGDDAEGVAVVGLGVGLGEMEAVAPGDVRWIEGEAQVTPHQGEGEGVAFDFAAGCF